jgi:hypothetical protein
MRLTLLCRTLATVLLAAGLGSCGDESGPDENHDVPTNGKLFVGSVDVSDPGPLTIAANATVRVEVKFYNSAGEEITGINADHFARVNVTPPSLVTVNPVSGENFLKDITAGPTGGTGTYTIGYGHTLTADERTFGLYDIVVSGPPPTSP